MDLERACLLAFIAIFNDEHFVMIDEKHRLIKRLAGNGLRYVDLQLDEGKFRILEQNPRKQSKWARMARTGHKILWVFKGGHYYARMVDGVFQILK